MTDNQYRIPKSFTLQGYLGNAWRLIREPGPDRDVVVRFSKIVAQNVAEVQWHHTQRISKNDDGTIDFRVLVSGLREISWWIMGYGTEAAVIQPDELREMIRNQIRRMVIAYQVEQEN